MADSAFMKSATRSDLAPHQSAGKRDARGNPQRQTSRPAPPTKASELEKVRRQIRAGVHEAGECSRVALGNIDGR